MMKIPMYYSNALWRVIMLTRSVGQQRLKSSVVLYIDIRYARPMIRNFASRTAQDIYDGVNSRYARKVSRELHPKARRLWDQINAAPTLTFLRIPPSNRLEKLSGSLAGYWSLRINDQWRIIFRWIDHDAVDVDITDYH